MKQLIYKALKQHRIPLIVLTIIAIVIWFCCPFLLINDRYLLQPPEKRIYAIGLIYLGWLLYIFALPKKSVTVSPDHPEARKKVLAQQGRFQGAIRFLKNTQISKYGKNNFRLSNLPWYLLIGPSGAGKTTLLANANVSFVLTKQFKQEKINSSDLCNWWATRDLVIVDVPGFYIKEKDHYLWNNFLNLMKKDCEHNTLNSVVIALPLPELIKHQHKKIAIEIKHKILQLREQFKQPLNFYFVITKCDQLPGFLEFFSECGTEELAQAWGVTIPAPKPNENIIDLFTQRFDALIKRLNSQLIWRLQQERNVNARPPIKDFPLQVERLKEGLIHFLKLLAIPDLHVNGMYLTSAIQTPTEENASQSQIININTQQTLQLLRSPTMPSKAYFIRQFILAGLLSSAEKPAPASQKNRWKRRIAYAASVLTIIAAAILLGKDFQQSVLQTYAIQNDLAQYQLEIQQTNQDDDHLIKALPLLNALQATANHSNSKLSRATSLMSFYSDKSHKTAQIVYQEALKTIVLPEIKNQFESYLKNSTDKNPVKLYAVLKAYLMLGDPQNFQQDYVIAILQQLRPKALDKLINDDLVNHIHAAFEYNSPSLTLNNEIIAGVRKQLTSLPTPDLAFTILKNINNNNADSTIGLGTSLGNPPIFTSKQVSNQIPILYTSSAFSDAVSQEIPIAATEALQGNWVLGNADILSNEATINALTEQLRARYISNYVDIWESLLSNLKLVTPTNLSQTDTTIANLMSDTSPLLQLLKTIKENTAFELVMNASPKLQALNDLLTNAHNEQENTLYQVFVTLRQLHFHLLSILSSNDVGQSAFDAAKNRMQNPFGDAISQVHVLAEQSPEPMKSWLNNLAAHSWQYELQEASHYIENAWQVNVLTIYHSQIANKNADDMDIQLLAGFIGKQGTLSNFYQHYLKPFVNDSGRPWQWRVVDNQRLPFANNVLAQLQETAKLQNLSKYKLFTQARKNPVLQHLQIPERLDEKG